MKHKHYPHTSMNINISIFNTYKCTQNPPGSPIFLHTRCENKLPKFCARPTAATERDPSIGSRKWESRPFIGNHALQTNFRLLYITTLTTPFTRYHFSVTHSSHKFGLLVFSFLFASVLIIHKLFDSSVFSRL